MKLLRHWSRLPLLSGKKLMTAPGHRERQVGNAGAYRIPWTALRRLAGAFRKNDKLIVTHHPFY
ncbi:MAG: hypothetical protein EOO06_19180 [Chitinophagaceae bacterium]|nr:MAG: hypothetical protein EOO06_19180 [Chitinophagaceae bacterium]